MSVANVYMHEEMPKENILAFNVTLEYTIKFIWLILLTITQNDDVLDIIVIILLFWYYVFHKVV